MKLNEWDAFGGMVILLIFVLLAGLFVISDQLSDINIGLMKLNHRMEAL